MRGYNTHTEIETNAMLEKLGLKSKEDLFSQIPKSCRLSRRLDLPAPVTEWELEKHLSFLAGKNATTKTHSNFLGGGFYEHYVPSVVDAIVERGEFLTSYTPYQPEMSQGLLQCLFEYQQLVSKITGLPVVNSSSYDGATALADAAWTACRANGNRHKLLVSENLFSQYHQVLNTYCAGRGVEIVILNSDGHTGRIDQGELDQKLKANDVAGFIFQSPNAFGVLEDISEIARVCKENKVLSVLSFNPLTSGLFDTPGALGVDVVTAEGQPLGLHLNAGGPSLGIFSTKKEFRKFVPGRLVGKVSDINGKSAYALVFEDREQHVAREKATSNICSNQALNAIRAAVYLAYLGEHGFESIAYKNALLAHKLCTDLLSIPGVELARSGEFYNEFVLKLPVPVKQVLSELLKKKIFAGRDVSELCIDGSQAISIAVTEVKSEDDLKNYVEAFKLAVQK